MPSLRLPTLRAVLPDFLALRALAERLQRDLQPLCLECARVSDDDNLSRSGQTFVSIDAMATVGLAASGADPAADLPGDDAPSAPPGVLVPGSAAATDGPASTDRA